MEQLQQYEYQYNSKYDKKYKVKRNTLLCFSKKKLKKISPKEDYTVIGETIKKNKEEAIGQISLCEKYFEISKEKSHSKWFFRRVGYIEEKNGNYISLLKRRFIIFILLFLFLLMGILFSIYFTADRNIQVSAPEVSDTGYDTVLITLPYGQVEYKMIEEHLNDLHRKARRGSLLNKEYKMLVNTNMELYILHDDKEDLVNKQKLEFDKNGNIVIGQLDFPSIHFELKEGDYIGYILFIDDNGKTIRYDVEIKIRRQNEGKMSFEYKKNVTVNKNQGIINFSLLYGKKATHDITVQIILLKNTNEYLLATSKLISPGTKLTSLDLDKSISQNIQKGVYKGYIRMYIYTGKTNTKTSTDVEVSIIVN